MLKQLWKAVSLLLVPALVVSALPRTGVGALIPHDLEQGAQAAAFAPGQPDAAVSALHRAGGPAALDRAELAQLQRTDLRQKGGDPSAVTVLAVIGAVALLIWLVRGIGADTDDDDDADIEIDD